LKIYSEILWYIPRKFFSKLEGVGSKIYLQILFNFENLFFIYFPQLSTKEIFHTNITSYSINTNTKLIMLD